MHLHRHHLHLLPVALLLCYLLRTAVAHCSPPFKAKASTILKRPMHLPPHPLAELLLLAALQLEQEPLLPLPQVQIPQAQEAEIAILQVLWLQLSASARITWVTRTRRARTTIGSGPNLDLPAQHLFARTRDLLFHSSPVIVTIIMLACNLHKTSV